MADYYILEGREIRPAATFEEYLNSLPRNRTEWMRKKRVALTEVIEGIEVSTVFLGSNHQFGPGAPLLFETMVFGGPLDQEMDRYSSYDAAEVGHKEMVERVRAALEARANA